MGRNSNSPVRGQIVGHTFYLIGQYIVLLRTFTKVFMVSEFHFYAEPYCEVIANFNHSVKSYCLWVTLIVHDLGQFYCPFLDHPFSFDFSILGPSRHMAPSPNSR